MSFAISIVSNIPTITQSGTDTSWSGIDTMVTGVSAVAVSTGYSVGDVRKPPAFNGFWYRCTTAGTTAGSPPLYGTTNGGTTTDGSAVFTAFLAPFSVVMGDLRQYNCQDCRIVLTGTLTIAEPARESPICLTFATSSAANYTSGTFASDGVTPRTSGVHFNALKKGPNNFTDQEAWDGIWATRGGSIIIGCAYSPTGTGSQIMTGVDIVSSAGFGTQSIRWRSYATNLRMRKCRTYDVSLDLFNIPPEIDVKGFACEYVAQYVGSQFGGTDAKLTMSALSNLDGTFDFDNYSNGWVEIYDCAKAAALNVVCQQGSADHCVPLFQNLNFTVSNLAGVVQDGVRFTCTDAPTNSPTVTITTRGSLKTWDFRNPLTYTGLTAGGGLASSVPCLKVWHGSANTQNLRFPSSTATYRFCGYKLRQLDKSIVLGSDTPQAIGIAGEGATNCTLSEAAAAALTGIALAPSGATGGTATVTVARDVLELWQYFRAWKPLNLTSDDTWLPSSGVLSLGAWNLTCSSVVLSAVGGFSEVATTGTITGTLASGGAYTYVNGSLVLPLSLPSLTGGTINIGAAATYAFASAGSIISMTPSAPSTYTFTGAHTGTVSLKNAAAHAITVILPLGTAFTTAANVGGAITVVNPTIFGTATITGAVANSRILVRNVTTATTISNAVGTGYSNSYAEGSDFTTGHAYSVTVTHVDKLEIIYTGTVSASGFTVTVAQLADDVYVAKGFDGSTFTGVNFNAGTIDLDLDGGTDPLVLWGETYARYKYQTTLSGGITTLIGAMFAKDLANFLFSNAIVINNLSGTPVQIGGDGYGSRRDGLSMFGSGSIRIDNSTSVLIANAPDITAIKAKTDLIPAIPASSTNITAGVITTVTNLTNAPTAGDLTATMKTSVTAAVPAGVSAVAIRTEMDSNSTRLSAIDSKTTNLPALPASTTNITAGTITTVTNLTNAPTTGDFTAAMKASITAAVPAGVSAAAIRAEMDANSTKLDVAVGTRLPSASYSTPPTAAAIRSEIDANSTKLDVATSTRLSTAGYTAPNNAGIAAIPTNPLLTNDSRLNNLDAAISTVNSTTNANAIAAANPALVVAAVSSAIVPVNIERIRGQNLIGDGAIIPWGPA